jgi:hypothetical protein
LRRADPPSKESCRLRLGLKIEKVDKVQQKDCTAIDSREIGSLLVCQQVSSVSQLVETVWCNCASLLLGKVTANSVIQTRPSMSFQRLDNQSSASHRCGQGLIPGQDI